MRTGIIVLTGLGIWAVGIFLAHRMGKPGGSAVSDTTLAFVTFWFLATATNMWIGVAQAGHTFREALPVSCIIFGLPALVATVVKWKFF